MLTLEASLQQHPVSLGDRAGTYEHYPIHNTQAHISLFSFIQVPHPSLTSFLAVAGSRHIWAPVALGFELCTTEAGMRPRPGYC